MIPGGENWSILWNYQEIIALLYTFQSTMPTTSLTALLQCLLICVLVVVFLNSNKAERESNQFLNMANSSLPWPQCQPAVQQTLRVATRDIGNKVWMDPCKSTAARKKRLKSQDWVSQITFQLGETDSKWVKPLDITAN